jgi:hypothetical protein
MCALTAAVEVSVALCARAVEVYVRRSLCSARGALRRLAECHHSGRARSFAILRLLRLGLRLWSLRFAIAFHIAALTVFAHLINTNQSPRSGRWHKAWGGAQRNPRNCYRKGLKPAERPKEESSRSPLVLEPLSAASRTLRNFGLTILGFRCAPPQALCHRPLRGLFPITRVAIDPLGLPLLQTIREGIQRTACADK